MRYSSHIAVHSKQQHVVRVWRHASRTDTSPAIRAHQHAASTQRATRRTPCTSASKQHAERGTRRCVCITS